VNFVSLISNDVSIKHYVGPRFVDQIDNMDKCRQGEVPKDIVSTKCLSAKLFSAKSCGTNFGLKFVSPDSVARKTKVVKKESWRLDYKTFYSCN
jgi:hypothetical protein